LIPVPSLVSICVAFAWLVSPILTMDSSAFRQFVHADTVPLFPTWPLPT
jgi:hypothetical protein